MKKLVIVLSFLLAFLPAAAYAGEPTGRITKIPWAGTLLSEVDPNVTYKVPFPGVLLDNVAYAEIKAKLDNNEKILKDQLELKDLEKLKLQLQKDKEIAGLKVELKWVKTTYEERIKVKDQYTKRLEDMIKDDADDINWVPWAFVGGVVIGAVAAVAIAFAVNEK